MNRREFSKKLGITGVLAPAVWREPERAAGAQSESPAQAAPATASRPPDARFPPGNHTPFGYLDNPYHSWDLHPSGVVRSVPPLGIGWYYPAGPGGYFYYKADSVYRASLRLGLVIGGRKLFECDDFRAAGIEIASPHHSKDLLKLEFTAAELAFSVAFFLVGENTIACQLSVRSAAREAQALRLFAVHRLELGDAEWWGRDGISASFNERTQLSIMRSFAAGPVFVLKASHPLDSHFAGGDAALEDWMAGKGAPAPSSTAYFPDPLNAAVSLRISLPPGGKWTGTVLLSRSQNARFAGREAAASLAQVESVHAAKIKADSEFWSRAPRLEGDFPEHWKHSWVYDFETLRMMVRRPVGVYKHPWDAMQIQAPRNVLAETSIDMWALSYADPESARAVLLGQFADAVEANVPCMREDGTMNMVAADGSECGTSVQWCYPFYCIESVFLRTADKTWLGKLYPYLSAFLDWTLENRTDSEGWVVAKCSWESGMDASSRFLIKQPTGGELIDFIRVAEIQAAMAHAAGAMRAYATLVGRAEDIPRWQGLFEKYAAKTRELFFQGWFYDVDGRSGKPIVVSGHREVTQMAPLMCGVAGGEQIRAMTPALLEYTPYQEYWLEWPSLVLPYAESMWRAGLRRPLAKVLFEIADRAYRSMDRRELEAEKHLGWPGVSCEYWGQNGAAGGEGYGWGATLPAHIIRSMFGFRELAWTEGNQFELGPNIPDQLSGEGKSFSLLNLHFRSRHFDLRYRQTGEREFRATLTWAEPIRGVKVADEDARAVAVDWTGHAVNFTVKNHEIYRVVLSSE